MDVFALRNRVIDDYRDYITTFMSIRDERIQDEVDYIMDTFPIVKRKDETAHGEYRTKRLILERYDALAAATAAGRPQLRTPRVHSP